MQSYLLSLEITETCDRLLKRGHKTTVKVGSLVPEDVFQSVITLVLINIANH